MIATALYLGLLAIAYAISGKNPLQESVFFGFLTFIIIIADFWLVISTILKNYLQRD